MKLRINIKNKTSPNPQLSTQARTCNCINKSSCPLNNKCLSDYVLYQANVTSAIDCYGNKVQYGINETANHRKSFKNLKIQNRHCILQQNLETKGKNKNLDISWEILGIHQSMELLGEQKYHVRKSLVTCATQLAGSLLLKMLKYLEVMLNIFGIFPREENCRIFNGLCKYVFINH